ncbi:preprotein translocase subunit SecF/SecD/SecF fusion protein [Geomicrobium halophilum]|uniref:Protein-export membrane protein SecF n=2 Tax=Geomicrobium halophilum TaxID=549000 RepID=A0A841PNX9_9BACL|nr:protein translocase subunit SecF [Geomicrobium halophilum]MBB6449504.1 preprotein translocase subunit SecF/SecD/SecF fusion protein [Geomicrobium halophilum]
MAKKNIDLIKHRKKYFVFTIAVVLAGAILLSTMGLNLGIDFESGTRVDFMSEEPLTEEEIENEFAVVGLEPDDITLAGENNEQASAQFIGFLEEGEVTDIQGHFEDVFGSEPNVSTVSPQIGRELAINALIATGLAALGIVIYVAIRFEFLYGLAAITALLYDAFLVISVFSLLQLEINIPFIAAVLTVVGYSINDTIVTFDRIRENVKKEEEITSFDHLAGVVNNSLLQTLTRSLNTVITVLFAAVAIWLLGSEAITSFAFAIVIGMIAGTYSSLFFAAQLWLVWKYKVIEKERNKPVSEAEES